MCVCVCVCGHWYWFSRRSTPYLLGHTTMSFINARLLGRCRHPRKGQDETHETSNSGKQPRAEIPRANWQATKHNHRKMKWQSTMTEKHKQQHQGAHNSETWREFKKHAGRASLFAKMSRGGQFLKPSIPSSESNAEKQNDSWADAIDGGKVFGGIWPTIAQTLFRTQLVSCVLLSIPSSC